MGLVLIIQPTLNAALSVVSGKAVRRATSLVSASRQIFLSLGVAMLASILQIHIQGPGIPKPQEILQGFEDAYLITFWAAVASFCLSLLTPGWPAPRKVIELPIHESGSEARVVWDDVSVDGVAAPQQPSMWVEAGGHRQTRSSCAGS